MDLFSRILNNEQEPLDIDEEYYELSKKFKEEFGKSVPREMMPPAITDAKVKEAIKACLESGNGDILGLLGVNTKGDVLY